MYISTLMTFQASYRAPISRIIGTLQDPLIVVTEGIVDMTSVRRCTAPIIYMHHRYTSFYYSCLARFANHSRPLQTPMLRCPTSRSLSSHWSTRGRLSRHFGIVNPRLFRIVVLIFLDRPVHRRVCDCERRDDVECLGLEAPP